MQTRKLASTGSHGALHDYDTLEGARSARTHVCAVTSAKVFARCAELSPRVSPDYRCRSVCALALTQVDNLHSMSAPGSDGQRVHVIARVRPQLLSELSEPSCVHTEAVRCSPTRRADAFEAFCKRNVG